MQQKRGNKTQKHFATFDTDKVTKIVKDGNCKTCDFKRVNPIHIWISTHKSRQPIKHHRLNLFLGCRNNSLKFQSRSYLHGARHMQSEIQWAWSVSCAIQHWKWSKIKVKDVFSSLGSYNYDKGKTHFNDNVVTCFLCAHSCMCWCAVKQKERSDQTKTADGKDNALPLQGGSIYNSALTSFHKKTLSKFFFFLSLIRISIVQPLKSTWGFTLSLIRRWLREKNSFPQSQHCALKHQISNPHWLLSNAAAIFFSSTF